VIPLSCAPLGAAVRKRGDALSSLRSDVATSSDWIAGALAQTGYGGDFSPESLWELDRFLEDHTVEGRARRGGPLADDVGAKLFALGAYLGEVIRRDHGGEWRSGSDDEADEVNIELRLPDGTHLWPVQRVMKRFQLGEEEGLAAYALAVGVPVGPAPAPRPKPAPWWQFWR
jgi:hypothetical protein